MESNRLVLASLVAAARFSAKSAFGANAATLPEGVDSGAGRTSP